MQKSNNAFAILKHFIGENQLTTMRKNRYGEEGQLFVEMIDELVERVSEMPKPYETDGQGDKAKAVLHYFMGGFDWYIVERDSTDEQLQAFGVARLNSYPEKGYISIQEIIEGGAELDLYFEPKPLSEVMATLSV